MHLVLLCNEYPPFSHGGIGILDQTLARRLVKGGWSVSVVGTYHVTNLLIENDQGVIVYRNPAHIMGKFSPLIDALHINNLLQTIQTTSPIDLLEGSELSLALISRRIPGVKIIRMSGGHNFFSISLGKKPRFWRNLLERSSFSKADHLCAVSNYVAETTRSLMNLGAREITILHNPVDTNLFQPHPEIIEEPGSILFVGTVTEKKGIRQLVLAMSAIREAISNAHLYVVGRDSIDKETCNSYTERLKNNIPSKLKASIQFIGPVQNVEVKDWIARCQVCVYPSHMEAQPIVVIEAMASGKAVVASKTGPGPELIENGVDGLLCDPYSPDSIAEKVILLLGDPVLRNELSVNARKKAEAQFSIDVLIDKNIEFYKKCLSI
jgi:glycosyltransferase involved in cell wall biosynthesis